jgi:hypothetical protein
MWASLEDDLATDPFAVCVERTQERDVAGIPQQHTAVSGLDLLREPFERLELGGAPVLVERDDCRREGPSEVEDQRRPDAGGRESCGTNAPSSPLRGHTASGLLAQCPDRCSSGHAPVGASETDGSGKENVGLPVARPDAEGERRRRQSSSPLTRRPRPASGQVCALGTS